MLSNLPESVLMVMKWSACREGLSPGVRFDNLQDVMGGYQGPEFPDPHFRYNLSTVRFASTAIAI